MKEYDAIIVGSGPNGFAAGITLALRGLSVIILEEKSTIGGGVQSSELTLPGYIHDVCSTIYPFGIGSPFFRSLPLSQYGLEWIQPPIPMSHPFDDGSALFLDRTIAKTCRGLGEDAAAYKDLMTPLVEQWPALEQTLLGPLTFPKHPLALLSFAMKAMRSAESLANAYFKDVKTKGFFAGLAAHSFLPLNQPITAAFALVLSICAHSYGWPIAKGGSQSLTNALAAYFQSLGGVIQTDCKVSHISEIASSKAILFDLTPRQILSIAGEAFTPFYRRQLEKYRYGPGVYKMDFALNEPIPWKAKECRRSGTIHIGGEFSEIAASERGVWNHKHSEKPFIILAQQSLFDPLRAPQGKHTAWAYCHVPSGSTHDMTHAIENQIERFAPGFRDTILFKHSMNTQEIHHYNANYIGGDIIGGVQDIWQLFTRPVKKLCPYSTSNSRLFICSSSTPPGGGVHGMCGTHAAQVVLKKIFH